MKRNDSTDGTDNVLFELGFEDAAELSAKAMLALRLNHEIDSRGLKQAEVAKIIGMPQPKVSLLRRYKLQDISLERLMLALVALGQHVEISVKPAGRSLPAAITVKGAGFGARRARA